MDLREFMDKVEEEKKAHPFWFDDENDPPATADQIVQAENEIGVTLPEQYRIFLEIFGGGYFAFTNIFSVCPDSDWNMVERNKKINIPNFVAISDDESGGLYGYLVENMKCSNSIYYWDHDSNEINNNEKFKDLFAYLIEVGLTP